jgi:cytochrome c oxidase subunit 2
LKFCGLIPSINSKFNRIKFNALFLGIAAMAISCSSPPKKGGGSVISDASTNNKVVKAETRTDMEAGKSSYMTCAACHGYKAEGTKALSAPALANQEPYYLKQQINNFRNNIRGLHKDDLFGSQMLPMAKTLKSDKAVDDVIAYIKSLGAIVTEITLEGGDANKGKSHYQMVCGACHGPGAKGNESLHSPNLIGMEDWYVKRQIENFKAGVRGSEPGDLYGSQMLQISNSIQDEQTILDLTAYFHSLQGE